MSNDDDYGCGYICILIVVAYLFITFWYIALPILVIGIIYYVNKSKNEDTSESRYKSRYKSRYSDDSSFSDNRSDALTYQEATLFNLGANAMQNQDVYGAIRYWEQVVSTAPYYTPVLHNLSMMYIQVKDVYKAKKYAKRAVKVKPDDSTEVELLGMVYALEATEKTGIERIDPEIMEKSLKCFEKALRLNPNNDTLLLKVGIGYSTLGKPAKAYQYLHKYANRHPYDPKVKPVLDHVKAQMKRLKEESAPVTIDSIKRDLYQGRKGYESNEVICNKCNNKVLKKKFCIECGEVLEWSTEITNKVVCINCGTLLSKDKIICPNCGASVKRSGMEVSQPKVSWDHIEEDIDKLMIDQGVQNRKTAEFLAGAALYAKQGNLEKAIKSLRQAIELEPDKPFLRCLLGSMLFSIGNLKEGKRNFKKALEIEANFPDALEQLMDYYTREGKPEKVEKYYEKIKSLGSSHVKYIVAKGHNALDVGDVIAAVNIWKKALRLDPNNIEIELRIKCFEEEYIMEEELAKFGGDLQASMAHYQQRLRANPNDTFARKMTLKLSSRMLGSPF